MTRERHGGDWGEGVEPQRQRGVRADAVDTQSALEGRVLGELAVLGLGRLDDQERHAQLGVRLDQQVLGGGGFAVPGHSGDENMPVQRPA